MARRRSSHDRVPPKIQNLRWIGGRQSFSAQAAGTSAVTFITSAAETDTIMRIRGQIYAIIDAAGAPEVWVEAALGVILMPAGQGTTVVLSPITDPDAPWLLYERFLLGYEEMVTDVVDVPGATSFRKEIDVKAMRILRPDRELQLVFENVTLAGAISVNLSFDFRMLLGQH